MDKLINFGNYDGEPLHLDNRSKEYKALDKLEGQEWEDYLDLMARNGVTVEYDTANDEFIVTSSNKNESIMNKVNEGVVEDIKSAIIDKPIDKLIELYKKYIGSNPMDKIKNNAQALATEIATMVAGDRKLAVQVMNEEEDIDVDINLDDIPEGEEIEAVDEGLVEDIKSAIIDKPIDKLREIYKKYIGSNPMERIKDNAQALATEIATMVAGDKKLATQVMQEGKKWESEDVDNGTEDVNEGTVEDIRSALIDKPVEKLRELYKKYVGTEARKEISNNAKAMVTMIATLVAENPTLAKQAMMEAEEMETSADPVEESIKPNEAFDIAVEVYDELPYEDSSDPKKVADALKKLGYANDKKSVDMIVAEINKAKNESVDEAYKGRPLPTFESFQKRSRKVNEGEDMGDSEDVEEASMDAEFEKVMNEAELTDDAREFISDKISTLVGEGKPQDQAIAMAYSMAKEAGYEVPDNPNESEDMEDEGAEGAEADDIEVNLPDPVSFVTERKQQIRKARMIRESLAEMEAKDIYKATMDHTAVTESGEEVELKEGDEVEIQSVDEENEVVIAKFGDQEIKLGADDFVGDAPILERLDESDEGELFGDQIELINKWFETYEGAEEFEWNGKTLTLKDKDGNEIKTMSEEELSAEIPNFPTEETQGA